MNQITSSLLAVLICTLISTSLHAQPTYPSEITGRWNITIHDDNDAPAWLEISRSGFGYLVGSYVGTHGSARPVSKIEYSEDDDLFSFTIPPQWKRLDEDLVFEFSLVDGDQISGVSKIEDTEMRWTGKRAPDLTREEAPIWGDPVSMIDRDMSKWIIPEENKFRMIDGILVNEEVGGNLNSKETFDDFKLHAVFRYPERSNSGIYLRGRYEVQIADNYGRPPSLLTIGGVYGFIKPTVNAAKPAGEWQTMDITLVGRTVTIVLNGVEVISKRPIPGITGGALDGNEGEPGPIKIQGDHGPVEFKKLVVTPAVNR